MGADPRDFPGVDHRPEFRAGAARLRELADEARDAARAPRLADWSEAANMEAPKPKKCRNSDGPGSEHAEQVRLVSALKAAGVHHHASPGGARLRPREAAKMSAAGMSAGFPDLLIFAEWGPLMHTIGEGGCESNCDACTWGPPQEDAMNVIKLSAWGQLPQEEQDQALRKFVETPMSRLDAPFIALELKRPGLKPKTARAHRWSGARPEQREWLERFEASGAAAIVAYGCDDAVGKLRALGVAL